MDINDKIAIYGAFAPIAYEHHCKSVLLDLLAYLDVDVIFEIFGKKQFLPGKNFVNRIAPDYCYHHPQLCNDELMLIVGPSQDLNASRIQVYVSETPADTSVKNMAHWSQDIKRERFGMFDYGTKERNYEHYHSDEPPQYNLSKVLMPTALYSGTNDYLADPTDVATLESLLNPSIIVSETVVQGFAHMDFVWGVHAQEYVYYPFISHVKKYLGPGIKLTKTKHVVN